MERRKRRRKEKKWEPSVSCWMKTEFREVKGTVSFDRAPRRQRPRHDDRRRREIHFHRTTVAHRARHRASERESSGSHRRDQDRRITEQERKEKTRKRTGEEEGVEIIEIQASCFATSTRERTRTATTTTTTTTTTAAATTKFHGAARNSCETRVSVERGFVAGAKFKIRARREPRPRIRCNLRGYIPLIERFVVFHAYLTE